MACNLKENLFSRLLCPLICTGCSLQYSIKDGKGSRYPVLLDCGHSICEFCLQKVLNSHKKVVCHDCNTVSNSSSSFLFNKYLVGNLVINQYLKHKKGKELSNSFKYDFNYLVRGQSCLSQELETNSCEECSMKASWYCVSCECDFCEVCWCKVHENTKSLMKHCKTAIKDKMKHKNRFKKCSQHKTQNLEFFCKSCLIPICSYCIISHHQGNGHCPVTLKEKNVEILNEFKMAAEKAESVYNTMRLTLEKIKLASNTPETFQLENQITKNFSRLHGILQQEESKLLEILGERSEEWRKSLKTLESQLEKQLERVETLLRESETAVENIQDVDLQDLHKQLREVENLPCHFISHKTGTQVPKVEFDESLMDSVRAYCKMELCPDTTCVLSSCADFSEGIKALESSNMKLTEEITVSGTHQEESVTKSPKAFTENNNYAVHVSYIKNPEEFYVILHSRWPKKSAIEKMSQSMNFSSVTPEAVAKDEVYLVQYNVDKKWYRARVIEVLPSKKPEPEDVVVYYVDYGNLEKVPVSRVKPLPVELSKEPPLAIRCKLFDCVPRKGAWCLESTKTMEKILHNYIATMFVMEVNRDILEVDLKVSFPEDVNGEEMVSVRDALLFLEYSSSIHGNLNLRNAITMKYPEQNFPRVGETFDGVLVGVQSPFEFYVQQSIDHNSWRKLRIELQNYYKKNLNRGLLYNPVVGMPCAVVSPQTQMWFRAKITDVPGRKMVTVCDVDLGNQVTVPWTSIRKLKQDFLQHPPTALRCSLAKVHLKSPSWNSKAKSYLEKFVFCSFRVCVSEEAKSTQKLQVVLSRKLRNEELCLNEILEENGGNFNPNFSLLNSSKNVLNFVDDCKENVKETRLNNKEKTANVKNGLSPNQPKKCEKTEKSCPEEYSSDASESETENNGDTNKNLKIKVKVLSAESPSSIYVTFPALRREFTNLQAKLNEFYENSTPDTREWSPDSLCVVFSSERNSWYRASILEILPKNRVKVFLNDVAAQCTESILSLRELDPSFGKYGSCAVKCHLADVRPPSEKWPMVSSEYLLNEIENHKKIYMTKRGEIENKSLPVELWVQKFKSKEALEPITTEWVTLNQLLVSQGLAVPDKPELWCVSKDVRNEGIQKDNWKKETKRKKKEKKQEQTKFSESPWPPAEPLNVTRFVGVPTYVDFDAFIYAYDVKDECKLKKIQESLHENLKNLNVESEVSSWKIGQPCFAKYHVDNCWYRGKIVKINDDESVDVFFVDYGNVENCQNSDLRKKTKTEDEFPTLTHKFQLKDIKSASKDKKWSISAIDFIHSLLVDKKCEISVCSVDESGVPTASFKIVEGDIDVAQVLASEGLSSLTFS